MKKILKIIFTIIFIILIILILLLTFNITRNYLILNKICKSNEEFQNSLNNYYLSEVTKFDKGELASSKREVYLKDNIYLSNSYIDDELYGTVWYDSKSNNSFGIINNDEPIIVESNVNTTFTDLYKQLLLNNENNAIEKILPEYIFKPIPKENNSYKIEYNNFTVWIDKETGLINKLNSNNITQTYEISKNTVTENDVKKPEI